MDHVPVLWLAVPHQTNCQVNLFDRILGEILEYHFLCQHATFNLTSGLLGKVREKIQENLGLWFDSFRALLPPDFCDYVSRSGGTGPTISAYPTIAYCGLHLYHCMHVLLYGQMDLVRMYEDAEWQASPDFIRAGEHAMACANVSHPSNTTGPQPASISASIELSAHTHKHADL